MVASPGEAGRGRGPPPGPSTPGAPPGPSAPGGDVVVAAAAAKRQEGNAALRAGDLRGAERRYGEALAAAGAPAADRAAALANRSLVRLKLGRARAALEDALAAEAAAPAWAKAAFRAGAARLQLRRFAPAARSFLRSLELDGPAADTRQTQNRLVECVAGLAHGLAAGAGGDAEDAEARAREAVEVAEGCLGAGPYNLACAGGLLLNLAVGPLAPAGGAGEPSRLPAIARRLLAVLGGELAAPEAFEGCPALDEALQKYGKVYSEELLLELCASGLYLCFFALQDDFRLLASLAEPLFDALANVDGWYRASGRTPHHVTLNLLASLLEKVAAQAGGQAGGAAGEAWGAAARRLEALLDAPASLLWTMLAPPPPLPELLAVGKRRENKDARAVDGERFMKRNVQVQTVAAGLRTAKSVLDRAPGLGERAAGPLRAALARLLRACACDATLPPLMALVAEHRGLGSEEIRTLLRAAAKPGPKTDYQRRVGTLSPATRAEANALVASMRTPVEATS